MSPNIALIVVGTFCLLTSLSSLFVAVLNSRHAQHKGLSEYTFLGDDHPAHYPLELETVALTPENTVHYRIYTADAAAEWESIFPAGGGFLRLGESQRPLGLAMFHQLHCLARLREAMNTRQSTEHVHHCLNYLRQTILCDANPTLEPVIPILGVRSVNAEVPRLCRDWTAVYRLAEENYRMTKGASR
ncbi:predicted protein [Postia placenta Mad-698-R]|nr:predicted protein [Postia placenta Mad-698-R]